MSSQCTQSLGDSDPALAALAKMPVNQPALLLHSGRRDPRWSTRSLLAGEPTVWFRHTVDGRSHLIGVERSLSHNLWQDLRTLLYDPELPGRWIGYFSYDIARVVEPRNLAEMAVSDWPLVELAWCPHAVEYSVNDATYDESRSCDAGNHLREFCANFTRSQYEDAVRHALDYIAAGDIFQVNLAQRFTADWSATPRQLYHRLANISPAWFGAYLELPDQRALLSTSPELFLRVEDGHVTTRPIKGTRPARRGDLSHPASNLRTAPKDTAELNMIIDLMRNDLGRVCRYGSVRVTEPRAIETHPTIHHATATIEGDLHPSKDIVDLLRATLPGGSITGAPKVRAMQIINQLEPSPRGPYCGCIGEISRDHLQLNIAIRTMLLTPNPQKPNAEPPSGGEASDSPTCNVSFSVGAGIVADSDPAAEYEETLDKARAMMHALTPDVTI
ncbi:anthranilate synthase component I family protein [Planctomycetales bacterium ZRK34]|nr:anthranilate synthase component I family protein [Planctomycetales bacterium ZRK34]